MMLTKKIAYSTWSAKLKALLLSIAFFTLSGWAVTPIDIATGVAGGVGIASDPANSDVYYVEFNSGKLRRIHITPGCGTAPTCSITDVAGGFSQPEDVALDIPHQLAFVTTRDDPGTTGALWRVDLISHAANLVTFNLGAPHQIVLDTPTNTAYVVGFDSGKLWKIDLNTGDKAALMTGLGHPVGLAITADRAFAYVTEQTSGQLTKIDLALHARIDPPIVAGLTAPFFIGWTDPAQYALYLVQRNPVNIVLRVDLPSSSAKPIITGLPFNPSGMAVDLLAGAAYVTTDSKVEKIALATLPMAEPVFLAVGHVPSTSIVDGYAVTLPGDYFAFQDSPFGGTLDILGNLSNFKALGATHYRVLVSYEGAIPTPLTLGWTTNHWDPSTDKYVPTPVAPIPGDDRYLISPEYPDHAERWNPAFLMMRWPSGINGKYTFTVEIFKKSGSTWTDLTSSLSSGNSMTVLVDNSGFTVDVVHIRQHVPSGPPNPPLGVCAIVTSGPSSFDVEVTAYDPSHHLLSYALTALWGHNGNEAVFSDSYSPGHVNAEGPHLWSGITNLWVPSTGWQAHCNCAHTFYLDAWKRTIDGYNYLSHASAHQSITINITAGPTALGTCPP